MKYYFLITGILCILYYLMLVYYSRKLRSTFAVFWLLAGGVHLTAGCTPLPAYVYTGLAVVCMAGWICFIGVEALIVTGMFSRRDRETDCIIILGAQVKGTKITDSLKRRLDRAVRYLNAYPGAKVIVSGGRGPGEDITEADAMGDYLISRGVDERRIIREKRSTSTRENLRYSSAFTDPEHDRIGIVTNGFHMYRALLTAGQEGYKNVYKIPASSNPVFQINYMTREFFAVISVWVHMISGSIKADRGKKDDR